MFLVMSNLWHLFDNQTIGRELLIILVAGFKYLHLLALMNKAGTMMTKLLVSVCSSLHAILSPADSFI